MATETLTRITIPNACRDSIGIKGVCHTAYAHNLDSLGISLVKTAKLADSSKQTAKEFIEEAVEEAWGHVFGDLRVQGFMIQGVKHTYNYKFLTETTDEASFTDTFERGCEFEQFFINKAKLQASGDVTVNFSMVYNGTTTTLYNDTLSDETLTVTIDSPFPYDEIEFNLTVSGTGSLYKTNNVESPILIEGYRECSERLFYCRYQEMLVQAVMYKAAALILNNSIFNDRYNDLLAFQKDEIAIRVSQLDSSLNLLNSENRINKYGLYQQEIAKLNDKLKSIVAKYYTHGSVYDCGCCFECSESISTKMVIP